MKYPKFKRLGVLVPATNNAVEADFQQNLVTGVSVHTARLTIVDGELSAATLDGMNNVLSDAVRDLKAAHVDAIAYGCTSGSFYKGPGWDDDVINLIREIAGVPAIATSPSVISALRDKRARRLSVVTPYPQDLNARLKTYLENAGFEVMSIAGDARSAARGHRAVNDQDPAEIAEFAIRHWVPEADALFCSCTAWRAMEAIPEILAVTGKPVITSNQATIWASMRLLAPEGKSEESATISTSRSA
ncbi:aspartate/glutamate racemase family protein [Paraburkholderia sp. Ac-20347]|uniref:maleate cis-trans isomerase family protein n=1 Tax=Paraburkholderia sp. Ac-20347 TaxID=2703892 RepID=UPI001980D73A|nr:aspartate/glutamate racemase family protein [Paraburkholderia sp. Ac-20347]MBN3807682.1 Asp/Glu racemase [Paraburkholderia sp. Ac-20347]